MFFNKKASDSEETQAQIPSFIKYFVLSLYTIYCVVVTVVESRRLKKIHEIKQQEGY